MVGRLIIGCAVVLGAIADRSHACPIHRDHGKGQALRILVSPAPDATLPADPTVFVATPAGSLQVLAFGDDGVVRTTIESLGISELGQVSVYALHARARAGRLSLLFLDGLHETVSYRIDPGVGIAAGAIRIVAHERDGGIDRVDVDARGASVVRFEWAADRGLLARGRGRSDVQLSGSVVPVLGAIHTRPTLLDTMPDDDAHYDASLPWLMPHVSAHVVAFYSDGRIATADAELEPGRHDAYAKPTRLLPQWVFLRWCVVVLIIGLTISFVVGRRRRRANRTIVP